MFAIVLRHADIELPRQPGDNDPGLNAAGRQRAADLARYLAAAGVSAIYTSGVRRADETAAPLAAALGITRRVPASTGRMHEQEMLRT